MKRNAARVLLLLTTNAPGPVVWADPFDQVEALEMTVPLGRLLTPKVGAPALVSLM